ncbi:ATP-binding protein [Actinacidiphila alni]|uniref:ATP-binding protein n=1 Tax=Actinacidiphila alni TaxID=380248 RepID=UPI0034565F15
MRSSATFDGRSASIAAARRQVASFLGDATAPGTGAAPADIVERAQLVVSELVTNAVKYAGGPCGLDLALSDGRIEISVWDTSSQPVTAMEYDPGRIGRHGLEIVAALCESVEVTAMNTTPGKRVTARLGLGVREG